MLCLCLLGCRDGFSPTNMSIQPETWCSMAGNMFIYSYIHVLAGQITIFAASIRFGSLNDNAEGKIRISRWWTFSICYVIMFLRKWVCLKAKKRTHHSILWLGHHRPHEHCDIWGLNAHFLDRTTDFVDDIDPKTKTALSPSYPINAWLKLLFSAYCKTVQNLSKPNDHPYPWKILQISMWLWVKTL